MRITLENELNERVTIETNAMDFGAGVSPDGTRFERQETTNLPGERWDCENGETFWRV